MTNRLTYAQLEGAWIQGGGDPSMAPLMAAIAEAESGGNPNATNPTDNNGTQTSWGLWQISNGTHTAPSPNWNDPVVNAQLAVAKVKSQGLRAWGTYDTGAYKAYLSGGTTPDTTGLAPGSGSTAAEVTGAAYDATTCLIGVNSTLFSNCFISKTNGRAVIGGMLLGVSAVIFMFGMAVLVTYGLKTTGAATATGRALSVVPGPTRVAGKALKSFGQSA